jgi:two-component system CheB/CheR fusion protein
MPIVGIGASAGGIDALQRFFRELPAETGMAVVVVLHLSPDHESNLAEILQSGTDMTVERATDGTEVRPDHVYVIAPGHHLTLRTGTLRVSTSTDRHNVATVDRFFRSLADDQGRNAVGIVLSGTGSDGTIGLRAIIEHGGVAVAQDPEDAEYDAMPQSAIATGLIDFTAPAGPLAEKLVAYRDRAGAIQVPAQIDQVGDDEQSVLQKILARLYTVTGHDFTHYDRSMVLRRLERRLRVSEAQSMEEYHRRLQNDTEETRALYKDLLTSVTNFFRGPEAFAALQETVIPKLFEDKGPDEQVRVWVPGCATGEEAYSLAMLLVEHADTLDHPPELQVFATDVNEAALDVGRERCYPEPIAADVTEERLRRFFEQEGSYYRVSPHLREIILFSGHDVLADPPFSTLDLVSCRNLLRYLNEDATEQVYHRFHYGLREGGFLLLGRNEPTQAAGDLFSTVDASNTILQARPLAPGERTYAPFAQTNVGGEWTRPR